LLVKFVASPTINNINTMKTVLSKNNLTQSLTTVTGVLAATAASSQAIVTLNQITLTGNKLTLGGNFLNADVTGDGINDINITSFDAVDKGSNGGYVFAVINGDMVSASINANDVCSVDAQFATDGVGVASSAGTLASIKYLNPISFTDARINGGESTQGYLEVHAFNTASKHVVELTRLVFNPNSTTMGTSGLSTSTTYTAWTAVPEPSSFGLLALGAGGLFARRRRQAA